MKLFSFQNQTELAEFLLIIAKQADKIGHHPDCLIYKCSELKIELFTHDKNEVTELDYAMANFIDSVRNQ
jgi:4a-hydroxytetrahydrobiopterin dehydratase